MKTLEVTEELRSAVQELLEYAQRIVDLQYDDATASVMQDTLQEVAEAFGIEQHEAIITTDESGKITVEFEPVELDGGVAHKPTLTVIEGDKPDKP